MAKLSGPLVLIGALLPHLTGCATAPLPAAPPTAGPDASLSTRIEAAIQSPLVFTPPESPSYWFGGMYFLPPALVSNPSGLTFGGRMPDGRILLWTVLDGSAVVKDHFPQNRTVVQIRVDLSSARPPEVVPITLDPRIAPCDLEAIDRDPIDGGLFVADERAPGEPACGGTGPGGEARSRIFKIAPDGTLLGGPWDTEVVNADNDGIEGLAARSEPDGLHLYVFEERKPGLTPSVLDYRVTDGEAASTGAPDASMHARNGIGLELARRLHLARPPGSTQTAADFRKSDGKLLVVDRDALELLEVDLDACASAESIACLRTANTRPLTIDALNLTTPGNDRHRLGLVEGITTDDEGALYLILDNNGDPYADGDPSPRLLRLNPQ